MYSKLKSLNNFVPPTEINHRSFSIPIDVLKSFNNFVPPTVCDSLIQIVESLLKKSGIYLTNWFQEYARLIEEAICRYDQDGLACSDSLLQFHCRQYTYFVSSSFWNSLTSSCYSEKVDIGLGGKRQLLNGQVVYNKKAPYYSHSCTFENLYECIQSSLIYFIRTTERTFLCTFIGEEWVLNDEGIGTTVRISDHRVQEVLVDMLDWCWENTVYIDICLYRQYEWLSRSLLCELDQSLMKDQIAVCNYSPKKLHSLEEEIRKLQIKVFNSNSLDGKLNHMADGVGGLISADCNLINRHIQHLTNDAYRSTVHSLTIALAEHNEKILSRIRKIVELSTKTTIIVEDDDDNLRTKDEAYTLVALEECLMRYCKTGIRRLLKNISSSFYYFIFLSDFTLISQEDVDLNAKLLCSVKHMKDILTQVRFRIQSTRTKIEQRLNEKTIHFTLLISEGIQWLTSSKNVSVQLFSFSSLSELKTRMTSVKDCISRLQQHTQELQEIYTEQNLLGIQQQHDGHYCDLDSVCNKMKIYDNLWTISYEFSLLYDTWFRGPFSDLDIEQTNAIVEQMLLILQGSKYICAQFANDDNEGKALEILLSRIEQFHGQYIPLIRIMCNPAIREHHWMQICSVITDEGELSPKRIISLEQIVKYNLVEHTAYLQRINDCANNEYKLTEWLQRMKEQWNILPITFQLSLRGTMDVGVRYATNMEQIQMVCDDQLLQMQKIRLLPYAAATDFDNDAHQWENTLALIQDIVHFWTQVQEKWLFLMPLLSRWQQNQQKHEDIEVDGTMTKYGNVEVLRRTWNYITEYCMNNPHVLVAIKYPSLLDSLRLCFRILQLTESSFKSHMEDVRQIFPRFYFLSDNELLQTLSSCSFVVPEADWKKIGQPSISKLFSGISYLLISGVNGDEIRRTTTIVSHKGETIRLIEPDYSSALYQDRIEQSFIELEKLMNRTIHEMIDNASQHLLAVERLSPELLINFPFMVIHSMLWVKWTKLIECAITTNSNLRSVKKWCQDNLNDLMDMIGSCKNKHREIISSLIIQSAYQKESTEVLMNSSNVGLNSFDWLCRLRMYYEEDGEGFVPSKNIYLRSLSATVPYGYEYLGNTMPHLIITPVTERYYRYLITALNVHICVGLYGHSGYDKMQMCKHISDIVAKPFFYFTYSRQNFHYDVFQQYLKGVCTTGAWVCFDQIDKIPIEKLSVFSESLRLLYLEGLINKSLLINDRGHFINSSTECAGRIFCTYSKISVNKSDGADVTQRIPTFSLLLTESEWHMILETFLTSLGFKEPNRMVEHIFAVRKVCEEIFGGKWSDCHIQDVMVAISNIKEKYAHALVNDEQIIWKALKCLYSQQILDSPNGVSIFDRICADLRKDTKFVWNEFEEFWTESFGNGDHDECEETNEELSYKSRLADLYLCLNIHRCVIILGESLSGKTFAYKRIADWLNGRKIHRSSISVEDGSLISQPLIQSRVDGAEAGSGVYYTIINPICVSNDQLYGYYDSISHCAVDGILANVFRKYATDESEYYKWIIFDGCIDASWMDGLHSVLRANHTLCLASGETIQMSSSMRIIIESDRLEHGSPAIVYRCPIIIFQNATSVDWRMLVRHQLDPFLRSKLPSEQCCATLGHIIRWLIPAVQHFIRHRTESCSLILSDNYFCLNFIRMIKCVLEGWSDCGSIRDVYCITSVCLLWSYAGHLNGESRKMFDVYYRSLLIGQDEQNPMPNNLSLPRQSLFPEKGSVFDWWFWHDDNDVKSTPQWRLWSTMHDPHAQDFPIIIPTNESMRQLFLLRMLVKRNQPVLMIGETNTGKSSIVSNCLYNLTCSTNNYLINRINVNQRMNADRLQSLIFNSIDRRRRGVYGPPIGKKCVIFIDDIIIPVNNRDQFFSTRTLLELLRLLMENNCCYHTHTSSVIKLVDILFVGGVTLSSKKNNSMDYDNELLRSASRFIQSSGTSIIFCQPYEDEQILKIFETIFSRTYDKPDVITHNFRKNLLLATMDICKEKKSRMLDINIDDELRQISRVVNGLLVGITCSNVNTIDQVLRLWVHEIWHVFGDRISRPTRRENLFEIMKWSCEKNLRRCINQYLSDLVTAPARILQAKDEPQDFNVDINSSHLRNMFFGAFQNSCATTFVYNEIMDVNVLTRYISLNWFEYRKKYGSGTVCIPFRYLVENVSIILSALRKDYGHVLISGVDGSGRLAAATLAASFISGSSHQIYIDERKWNGIRDGDVIKESLIRTGLSNKRTQPVILIWNISICCSQPENFDILSSLLNSQPAGITNFFSANEKSDIIRRMKTLITEQSSAAEYSSWQLFERFCANVRYNLRIILLANSKNAYLTHLLLTYPALSKYCTLIRFPRWPDDAFHDLTLTYLHGVSLLNTSSVLHSSLDVCAEIYSDLLNMTRRFQNRNRSNCVYVTAETYKKFLTTFCKFYTDRIHKLSDSKKTYCKGLRKLRHSIKQVSLLKQQLESLKPQLMNTSQEMEKLITKIEQSTISVEITKEVVAADEALANEAAATFQAIRDDCECDLHEAEPALQSATTALSTIYPADIVTIKSMNNPPYIVKLVLEAVCVMNIRNMTDETTTGGGGSTAAIVFDSDWQPDDEWFVRSVQWLTNDAVKFLDNLKNYDKDNIEPRIMQFVRERYISREDFRPEVVRRVSNACEGLCRWIHAIETYDRVIKIIRPKKIKLKSAESEYAAQMEKLNNKHQQLAEIMERLQSLRDELAEKTKKRTELEDSIDNCKIKLNQAHFSLGNLQNEMERWNRVSTELARSMNTCLGDTLLLSGIIVYLAPFCLSEKYEAIERWRQLCRSSDVPVSEKFSIVRLISTLTTEYYLDDGDDIYIENLFAGASIHCIPIENAVVIRSYQYPVIIIDPERESLKWIKRILTTGENGKKEVTLYTVDICQNNFEQTLTNALVNGLTMIVQNCHTSCPNFHNRQSLFEAVICKEPSSLLEFQNEVFTIHSDFRLYIIVSDYNFKYCCSISNKTTILNFSLNEQYVIEYLLHDNMLADTDERRLLEQKQSKLAMQCYNAQLLLEMTDQQIIHSLPSLNHPEPVQQLQSVDLFSIHPSLSASERLLDDMRIKQKALMEVKSMMLELEDTAQIHYSRLCTFAAELYCRVLPQIHDKHRPAFKQFLSSFHRCNMRSKYLPVIEMRTMFVNKYLTRDFFTMICAAFIDADAIVQSNIFSCYFNQLVDDVGTLQ